MNSLFLSLDEKNKKKHKSNRMNNLAGKIFAAVTVHFLHLLSSGIDRKKWRRKRQNKIFFCVISFWRKKQKFIKQSFWLAKSKLCNINLPRVREKNKWENIKEAPNFFTFAWKTENSFLCRRKVFVLFNAKKCRNFERAFCGCEETY